MPVIGTQPGIATAWPVFVDHMPDAPDNAICIYDTLGFDDGRIMRTGEKIQHPGFQIRIRAMDRQTAWAKAKEIKDYINTAVLRKGVTVESSDYTIQSVSMVGNIISLGQELDAKRRCLLTINGTITYKEV